MAPDRWYYLKHPSGFTPDLIDCVRSGWQMWKADVEATIRHWRHTALSRSQSPDYEFYEPEMSDDGLVVTIPVGGAGSYGSYHLFEETIPGSFHRYLPQWFLVDLERGRKDTAGWFPELSWSPLVPAEQRDAQRRFFPPPGDSRA